MRNRGQSFTVVFRKSSAAGKSESLARDVGAYQSKPGDARRSGRASPVGAAPVRIEFRDSAQAIEARLGVVVVGAVTHDAANGFFWAVYLPGMPNTPRPARDIEGARKAISHKVREWCEAAALMSVRR